MNRLLISLLFVLFSTIMIQAYDCQVNGICYDLDKERHEATVTYRTDSTIQSFYKGYKGKLTIPRTIEYEGVEYPVTEIGTCAFLGNHDITEVIIPETIKNIGSLAFSDCIGLREIVLPPSVVCIEESAFFYCSGIRRVVLPPDLISLTNNVFEGCSGIETVEVSRSWMPLAPNYFEGKPNFHFHSDEYQKKIEKSKDADKSETDIDIPIIQKNASKTFAIVIANEMYSRESQVEYARNDGIVFSEYLKSTLGIPENNVMFFEDATLNDFRYAISQLEDKCNNMNGDASVIVYYAGHGVPDVKDREAYLLPVDGMGSDTSTAFSLGELYSRLEKIPTMHTTVFLDACFSGAQRNGEMLRSTRGVRMKPKEASVGGNLVVISATKDDESAFPYEDKKHGMFTYFLLQKLKETKGDVNLGELAEYVSEKVSLTSILKKNKSQTPTVSVSPYLLQWKSLQLAY